MGFMRKALFIGTGGASGFFVRANSKKERTAKALEKQLQLQRQQLRLERQLAKQETARVFRAPSPQPRLAQSPRPVEVPPAQPRRPDDLAQLVGLRDQGVLSPDEFDTIKQRLVRQAAAQATGQSTRALPPNWPPSSLPPPPPPQPLAPRGPKPAKRRRGGRVLLLIVMVVLFLGLAAFAYTIGSVALDVFVSAAVVLRAGTLLSAASRRRKPRV